MAEYEYTLLNDLKADNKVYNVFGVVKYFREPRRTKGPDWNMTVVITDESLTWDGKLTFNLFLKDPSSFPALTRIGSVVRFHRIKIKRHNDQMQGLSSPGFAALVFERDNSPPKSTQPNYTYHERDSFRVKQLMEWSCDSVCGEHQKFTKTIQHIVPNAYFDLHCQVLGVVEVNENHIVFKVWDGTKPNEKVQILKIVEDDDARVQNDGAMFAQVKPFLVDVSVFDDHVKDADNILLCDYVTFYNLHAFVPHPFRSSDTEPVIRVELCLHQGSTYGRTVRAMALTESDKLRLQLNALLLIEPITPTKHLGTSGMKSPRLGTSTQKSPQPVAPVQESLIPGTSTQKSPRPGTSRDVENANKFNNSLRACVATPCLTVDHILPMVVNRNGGLLEIGREAPAPLVPYLSCLTDNSRRLPVGNLVRVAAKVAFSYDAAMSSVVMFCEHCHNMWSLPVDHDDLSSHCFRDRKRKVDVIVSRMRQAFAADRRVGRRCVETLAAKSMRATVKTGRLPKSVGKNLSLPLRGPCPSASIVNAVALESGRWLRRRQPCVMDTGRAYYTCPACGDDEHDPCVLKYKFYVEVSLSDFTDNVAAFVWEDQLEIDGSTVYAWQVVCDRYACERYRKWYRQVARSDQQIECTIQLHPLSNSNSNLHQLLKLTPSGR